MACYPSKIQHILYSEERYKDLIALKAPLEVNDDLNLNEKLRVFKGDKLAAQFEVGKQKSRNCYCSTCGIHAGAASRYFIVINWDCKQYHSEFVLSICHIRHGHYQKLEI